MVKSNSNLQITGFTVDPASQEITSLEVNGTPVSGSANLEDNKAATINVSTYTQPVEITPTEGKDGMKKATVTLSNIPSGVSTFYAWLNSGSSRVVYTKSATPNVNDTVFSTWTEDGNEVISNDFFVSAVNDDIITYGRSGAGEGVNATRYSSGDITL